MFSGAQNPPRTAEHFHESAQLFHMFNDLQDHLCWCVMIISTHKQATIKSLLTSTDTPADI